MAETRTKKYKQYRNQIKKEAQINEKLKKKNKDVELTKKKVSKIDEDFFSYNNEQTFSSIYFVLPSTSNAIKDLKRFMEMLDIQSLDKEFTKMMGVSAAIDDIVKDNGLVNKKYFESDSAFSKIDNFNARVNNYQAELSNIALALRDNDNYENDIIHKIREKDEEQRSFFSLEPKAYEKTHAFKYSKQVFIGSLVLTVILLITLLILFFI